MAFLRHICLVLAISCLAVVAQSDIYKDARHINDEDLANLLPSITRSLAFLNWKTTTPRPTREPERIRPVYIYRPPKEEKPHYPYYPSYPYPPPNHYWPTERPHTKPGHDDDKDEHDRPHKPKPEKPYKPRPDDDDDDHDDDHHHKPRPRPQKPYRPRPDDDDDDHHHYKPKPKPQKPYRPRPDDDDDDDHHGGKPWPKPQKPNKPRPGDDDDDHPHGGKPGKGDKPDKDHSKPNHGDKDKDQRPDHSKPPHYNERPSHGYYPWGPPPQYGYGPGYGHGYGYGYGHGHGIGYGHGHGHGQGHGSGYPYFIVINPAAPPHRDDHPSKNDRDPPKKDRINNEPRISIETGFETNQEQEPEIVEAQVNDEIARNIALDGFNISADSIESDDTETVNTKDVQLPLDLIFGQQQPRKRYTQQEALVYLRNSKNGRQLQQ